MIIICLHSYMDSTILILYSLCQWGIEYTNCILWIQKKKKKEKGKKEKGKKRGKKRKKKKRKKKKRKKKKGGLWFWHETVSSSETQVLEF